MAACGYLYGNLPAPFEDWMLLSAGATAMSTSADQKSLRACGRKRATSSSGVGAPGAGVSGLPP